ncbi:histidinol dehydrogenase [Spiractinospora alimapuensis]|uniref:histidinol dehydrogenase n=1 Tax=Spiractinospora alimapuensis TaxID=2820884 RepID=UPI001EEAC8FD|nr:histidinol dehydrogenase [Spiractinospora alimapuensis]QVQ53110.1 histidinol dehydrogenase [Spiractinospora alimapuensis]
MDLTISRTDLRDDPRDPRGLLPRAELDVAAALDLVRPICADVEKRGEEALFDLAERFDGVRPPHLRVPTEDIRAALRQEEPAVRAALEESIRRARQVHRDQHPSDHVTQVTAGGTVTERWVPVERVGLYVPGGVTALPSSVVMNVVPAQEAGVASLAVASPPQAEFDGGVHPTVLAACALLGVEEVYAVGGAQAVAMFAYGAGECAPADLVTGPGNIYVTAAKRLLKGRIGIDAEAGPTEIAVLADDTADPRFVAADLISQAEHSEDAASVLVTDSVALADAVEVELRRRVPTERHAARITAALNGPQSGILLVGDVDQGLRVVDAYAAEHLEVMTADARGVAARVRNAGAVFVGGFAPVSLGDYCAGSNHVLPTGASARYSSGLSVLTFLRQVHVVDYDAEALSAVADQVVALASAEDLPAHGAAVTVRTSDDRDNGDSTP